MIKINLVGEGRKPVVARTTTRQRKMPTLQGEQIALYALIAVATVGLIVLGLWYLKLNGQIKDNKRQIAQAQQRVAELSDIIRQVEEFERKEKLLQRKIEVITDLKNGQRGPVELMDEISKALPDLLWLDRLQQRGNEITLSGRAFNTNAIASFVENLDRVPSISEPDVRDIVNRGEVYNFTVIFTKAPPKSEEEEQTASA